MDIPDTKEWIPWVIGGVVGLGTIYYVFSAGGSSTSSSGSSGSSASSSTPGQSTADYVALANAAVAQQQVSNQGYAIQAAATTQQLQGQTALTGLMVTGLTSMGMDTLGQAASMENSAMAAEVAQTNALAGTANASFSPESSSIQSANNVSINATTQAGNAWNSFMSNGGMALL